MESHVQSKHDPGRLGQTPGHGDVRQATIRREGRRRFRQAILDSIQRLGGLIIDEKLRTKLQTG